MPRAKMPLKRDLLKQELADAIGENVADILTRPEVARDWGDELNYRNEKSLSNAGNAAPCFYLAPLGRNGWALYSRRDLRLWVHDPNARWTMENLKEKGRPYPWPPVPPGNPKPSLPTKSDAEAGLDNLTDDKDYTDMVLGHRRWT